MLEDVQNLSVRWKVQQALVSPKFFSIDPSPTFHSCTSSMSPGRLLPTTYADSQPASTQQEHWLQLYNLNNSLGHLKLNTGGLPHV